MIKKFHEAEHPSNVFCKKCGYWMAYVHAKKVDELNWICLECLEKEKNDSSK